jgi:hypothetical protein
MSLSVYVKGHYEEKPEVWLRKNKANSKPICLPSAGNLCLRYPKHETRNPKQDEFEGAI